MLIHAFLLHPFCILQKGIGRQGNDRDALGICTAAAADLPHRLVAIHYRHHQVGQDRIKGTCRLFQIALHLFFSIVCLCDLYTCICQKGFRNFHIQFIVLCKKHTHSGKISTLLPFFDFLTFLFFEFFKQERDRKCGSNSLPALHRNGSAHLVHQMLDDGHSQSGSLGYTFFIGIFPGKGFEQVGKKCCAHTDSVIRNHGPAGYPAFPDRLYRHLTQDMSAGIRIFDRIPQNIDKDLSDMQRASKDTAGCCTFCLFFIL